MKRIIAILALLLVLLPLRAQIVFTPQWTAQAQFAGYYVAQEKGFYDQEGISVQIVHPNATQSAEGRMRSRKSQATTLQLAQAIQIVDEGIPLVNLLQTSMNNGLVIICRQGRNPLQQKRAKVAIWQAGFTQLVECMARENQLEFEWIRAASSVNLFVAGAVDASVAMAYNEYYQILQAGITIPEDCIFRFSENGYNIQEDGLYVTREYYNKHKEEAEKFARASRRGWEYTAEHPEEALDIVMKYVERNHIASNRVLQGLMLKEILRMQLDPDSGKREFRIRPDMYRQAHELMLRNGEIKNVVPIESLCR